MVTSWKRGKVLIKAGTKLVCPTCKEPAVQILIDVHDGEGISMSDIKTLWGKPYAEGDLPTCKRCDVAFMMVRGMDDLAFHTEKGWVPFDPRH